MNLTNAETRFWHKVKKTPTCWLWQGAPAKDGYGAFWLDGRNRPAHRVSFMVNRGHVPNDMQVLHKCDVPACVNPKHLFLGTPLDNMQDKLKKGRANFNGPRGSANFLCRLSESKVRNIRRWAKQKSQASIARQLKVHPATICAVLNGTTWSYVK